jgi:monothiol glutaredoxin
MNADKVRELIQNGIAGSTAEVIDTTGTNDHFSAVVISDSFESLSLIEQHQMVYKAVGSYMTNEIHALEIKTFSKKQWKEKNKGTKSDINENPIILFMKGTKDMPMCGFSNQVVQILNHYGVDYKDVNVLTDPEIRVKLSEQSGWPTIPQLFVKGKLIGGADIAMELHQNGELLDILDISEN